MRSTVAKFVVLLSLVSGCSSAVLPIASPTRVPISSTPATPIGSPLPFSAVSSPPAPSPRLSLSPVNAGPTASPPANPNAYCHPQDLVLDIFLSGAMVDGETRPQLSADPVPPVPADPVALGKVVGDREYDVVFTLETGTGDGSVSPTEFRVTLGSPDGAERALDVRLKAGTATVAIPDGRGPGSLAFEADVAYGACGALTAAGSFTFTFVPAAVAARCPSNDADLTSLARSLDQRVRVANRGASSFGIFSVAARYSEWGVISDPGGYPFDPGGAGVAARAGQRISVRAHDPKITFTGGRVELYRRAQVVKPNGSPLPTAPLGHPLRYLSQRISPDGEVVITLPPTPGRYALGISSQWTQECLTGQGVFLVPLTIHA
jgi:hypothetical protein